MAGRGGREVPEEVVHVRCEEWEERGDVERVGGVADGDWEAFGGSRGLVAVLVATGGETRSPWAGGPEGKIAVGLKCVDAGLGTGGEEDGWGGVRDIPVEGGGVGDF